MDSVIKNGIVVKNECGRLTEAGEYLIQEVKIAVAKLDTLEFAMLIASEFEANCETCNGKLCKSACYPERESVLDRWQRDMQ